MAAPRRSRTSSRQTPLLSRPITALFLFAALFVAGTGLAAETGAARQRDRFSLFIVPTIISVGRASSDAPLAIPEDWQSRLEPPSPNMRVSAEGNLFVMAFLLTGVSLEPTLRLGPAELAALVGYDDLWGAGRHGAAWLGYRVSGVTAHWWNPVTLAALRLRKPNPSIGLALSGGRWRLAVKLHRYTLLEEQFVGVDCPGCANGERLIGEQVRERGWGQRYSLAWQPFEGHLRLETSYERNGPQLSRVQFTFGVRARLLGW